MKQWNALSENRRNRIERGLAITGRIVDPSKIVALLEVLVESGDRVCLEGNNQKPVSYTHLRAHET